MHMDGKGMMEGWTARPEGPQSNPLNLAQEKRLHLNFPRISKEPPGNTIWTKNHHQHP